MKHILVLLSFLFIIVTACQRTKQKPVTDLEISAIAIDTGVFNVRLHIPKRIRDGLDAKTIENLTYRVDSCIYHKGSKGNVYPIYIETIATANKYVLEYLVEFDKIEKLNMYYTDKYINQKTYPLKLK